MSGNWTGNTSPSLLPGVPSLHTLYFYLTEGCNLACRHCWLSPRLDEDGTHHAVLPTDVFETVIHEAKPLGLKEIKLTGGEPLLHPHFADLLAVARLESLQVNIETNGLLCTPELAGQIAKVPNAFVSVSIDGANAETHDWVRGVKGSFEKACNAVRHLAAAGVGPQVIMSLIKLNAGQLEEVIHMAEGLGAASLKFNIVQPTARGQNMHEKQSVLTVRELIALGRRVEFELAPHTGLSLYFDYPPAFRSLSQLSKNSSMCGILGIMGVLSTGHFALCGIGTHIKKLVFGRAGVHNVADLWNGHPVLKDIRAGLPGKLGGICAHCIMRAQCLGCCLAQNYYSSGELWAPYWFCEQAAEEGLFPATRMVGTREPCTRNVEGGE